MAPKKRILIVDEDPAVAAVTADMVRALGHMAVVACGAESALSIWKETGHAFDLAIIDYMLGNSLGTPLAERLISEKPEMPVLIISGMIKENVNVPPRFRFLGKPFTVEDLWKAIDASGAFHWK